MLFNYAGKREICLRVNKGWYINRNKMFTNPMCYCLELLLKGHHNICHPDYQTQR